jgi:hypothetical protein
VVLALACATAPIGAAARPALIVFGGGGSRESNEASLEAHVLLALDRLDPVTRVLFADGEVRSATVLVATPPDDTSARLARLFPGARFDVRFRSPGLPARTLPASRQTLFAALDDTQREAAGTVVLGVGHGLPEDAEGPAALALWDDETITTVELARRLDRRKRAGPLALVLGQCHSGAFTALAHRDADPRAPIAAPTRCVFAAVPADREASGCTADVTDPSARAYVPTMIEALSDPRVDLDGDGRVSLAEAHAAALVADLTIDRPTLTSGAWLAQTVAGDPTWATARASRLRDFDALVADAPPTIARPLRALADVDAVAGRWVKSTATASPLARATHAILALDARASVLRRAESSATAAVEAVLEPVRARVLERWPALAALEDPVADTLFAEEGAAIARHGRTPAIDAKLAAHLRDEAAARDELDAVERASARLERFVDLVHHAADRVVTRALAPAAIREDLARLEACEALVPR